MSATISNNIGVSLCNILIVLIDFINGCTCYSLSHTSLEWYGYHTYMCTPDNHYESMLGIGSPCYNVVHR